MCLVIAIQLVLKIKMQSILSFVEAFIAQQHHIRLFCAYV